MAKAANVDEVADAVRQGLLDHFDAIDAGDADAIRSSYFVVDAQARLLDSIVESAVSRKKAIDAATAALDKAEPLLVPADFRHAVSKAKVVTNDDRATVQPAAGRDFKMRRVDGIWRVDMARDHDAMSLEEDAEIAYQQDLSNRYEQLAIDLLAGDIADEDSLYDRVEQINRKAHQVYVEAKKLPPTTQPK